MLNLWCGRQFATPRFGVRGDRRWADSVARPLISISSPLTHMIYLLPFLSYSAGPKSVSVRPGYDDKYHSRSYRFVERQNGKRMDVVVSGERIGTRGCAINSDYSRNHSNLQNWRTENPCNISTIRFEIANNINIKYKQKRTTWLAVRWCHAQSYIVLQFPQIGDRRSNIVFGIVERPDICDHHCGDDLAIFEVAIQIMINYTHLNPKIERHLRNFLISVSHKISLIPLRTGGKTRSPMKNTSWKEMRDTEEKKTERRLESRVWRQNNKTTKWNESLRLRSNRCTIQHRKD